MKNLIQLKALFVLYSVNSESPIIWKEMCADYLGQKLTTKTVTFSFYPQVSSKQI